MTPSAAQLGSRVIDRARRSGFALAGICRAGPTDFESQLRSWLASGAYAEMGYLARNLELRLDVRGLIDGATSIVMVADLYETPSGDQHESVADHDGRIARYARGDDYHLIMRSRLHALCDELRADYPAHRFRAFVDTAPVLEREHAARAGLGWVGKHTLLIHPDLGSWMFLGGFATTLDLEPSPDQHPIDDHCGTCTRCIDACPTGAITPYRVQASRCISYLTIEHRSTIDSAFHEPIGNWIFGCDICQEVCPHNRIREPSHPADPSQPRDDYAPRASALNLLDLLGWSADERRERLRRSAMKRATIDMLRRNALIAAGNALRSAADPALRARIESIARDPAETDLVRQTARQVLEALQSYTGPHG